MEQELVKIYEYELDRDIVKKCIEEDRKIRNEDIKVEIHKVLEQNGILYKNRINEKWEGNYKTPIFKLMIEGYINKIDYDRYMATIN